MEIAAGTDPNDVDSFPTAPSVPIPFSVFLFSGLARLDVGFRMLRD